MQSKASKDLFGNSEVGKLMRSTKWSDTPVGDPSEWPQTLQTAIRIALDSPLPMLVCWGRIELTNFYNDAYAGILGSKHPNALGKSALDTWNEIREPFKQISEKVFTTGEATYLQNRPTIIDRFGYKEEAYFSYSFSALRDEHGDIVGMFGTITETTETVKAQIDMQHREDRFRTLIEKSTDAVQLVSPEGQIIFSSDSLKNVLGYTPEEIADTGVAPYLHPDDKDYFFTKFTELIKHPEKTIIMNYRVKHKDGSWAWLETVGVNHLNTPNINALVGNFRNITKQKRAEDKLKASEQRFRALAENIPNLAWMAKADGSIEWYNNRWYEYTGTTLEDMEGWGWQSVHKPEHLPLVLKKWKLSIKTGKEFEMVFPIKSADGDFRPFLTRVVPLHDENGSVTQWVGTNTDISEQLKTERAEARTKELEEITAQMSIQRKELLLLNQAKDEFISLASHQLRTPATAVKQFVGMMLEGYHGQIPARQKKILESAYESNDRQLKIVDDLLRVARADAGEIKLSKEKTNLIELVKEVTADLGSTLKIRSQKLIYSLPDEPVQVLIDKRMMRMVIENILDNASKYSPVDTEITVTVTSGKSVRLSVRDQGVGIADQDISRLFQKFSRIPNSLSIKVGGTGLGLYWAKTVVELHGGRIEVKSEADKGSRFTVILPPANKG